MRMPGATIRIRVAKEADPLGAVLRGDRPGWGLDFMGVPLLVYDIKKIREAKGSVECIDIPRELEEAAGPLTAEFAGKVRIIDNGVGKSQEAATDLPSNSLVVADGEGGVRLEAITEPWTLLDHMCKALRSEVTATKIAANAEIAETAVLSGPCVISEGVKIDDFCKIKGPVFIGPKSRIWTGSLVRESMIGADCEVGFGCEIARAYLMGGDRIAHHDVVLDSILGFNVWMGAFIGTTNKLLNNAIVKYKQDERLVDTGVAHFGAVFGHDSAIGAGTIMLPGRFVPPRAIIQAGTVYSGPADVLH